MSDTVRVPLESVLAKAELWPRTVLDRARVADFITLYSDGGFEALPPLAVVRESEKYLLADGWHRFHALRALQSATAVVCLVDRAGLTPTDAAYRHGLATASRAALPLSRVERRAAVDRLLADSPDLADREIARLWGLVRRPSEPTERA